MGVLLLYMSAHPSSTSGDKASQGPAWGLKEQLGRLGGGKNGSNNQQGQDRAAAASNAYERSKIRVSVTGPALTHKIEQVHMIAVLAHTAVFCQGGLHVCEAGQAMQYCCTHTRGHKLVTSILVVFEESHPPHSPYSVYIYVLSCGCPARVSNNNCR